MPPKIKKSLQWVRCETCTSYIHHKDVKSHNEHEQKCSLDRLNWQVPFINCGEIFTFIEFSENNDIAAGSVKNSLKSNDVVFLNLSAALICNFVIGEYVVLTKPNSNYPIARKFLPVNNSAVISALLSQKNLESGWSDISDRKVVISKLPPTINIAKELCVVLPEDFKIHNSFHYYTKNIFKNIVIHSKNMITVSFLGKQVILKIKEISGIDPVVNTNWYELVENTKWTFLNEHEINTIKHFPLKIGGMQMLIDELKTLLNLVLTSNIDINIVLVKSVLLYGPSGCGKTLLCNYLSKEYNCRVYSINGPEIFSKYYGETEASLKAIFSNAFRTSPSIIIMNDIENLCSKKISGSTDLEKRVVSTLISLFDDLHAQNRNVFVLATSNNPDSIEPALRRYGRIDKEIEVPVPSSDNRNDILNALLKDINHNLTTNDIRLIADAAHGFVGADLMNLCTQASMHALKTSLQPTIKLEDFTWATSKVKASAMREVLIEIPNVKWTDIGGQEELKFSLKQAVEWPLKHADSFKRFGIKPPSGLLMYGPPGCSKTMIAKALANESGLNFLSIKGPELFSKWVGESEKAVRELFRKARQVSPSIIFFDEIDALGSERSNQSSSASVHERVLAQLLTEMDGIVPLGNVTIIAATNRPDKIDRALLRPGRIDRIIYVPLPNDTTRLDIFNIKLSKMPIHDNVNKYLLVDKTSGYSGAEIQAVCHEAALKALEEDINNEFVSMIHFENALEIIKPRTPNQLLELYKKFSL